MNLADTYLLCQPWIYIHTVDSKSGFSFTVYILKVGPILHHMMKSHNKIHVSA
ncbi:hypothetical protein NE237_017531 [Protea cynaroides]|uniref:Uncharacterized protein n=1 Tax=Protea cynaroides TaxID=273540 RepID=A0A9Q0QN30_9MAGN|nr:hypothetical protein NE237_017531 [Protea cynaroides]